MRELESGTKHQGIYMYTYVVLKWRSKSWDGIYKEGKLHMRTCDHGAEDHGDAHLVALGEQVPVVVVDHDAPPGEVEDERRQDERQQLATRRRQRRRRRVGRLDDRLVNAVRTQLACMCGTCNTYVCAVFFCFHALVVSPNIFLTP